MSHTATIKSQWKEAARKARLLQDPWKELGFESLPEMTVSRSIYNPRTKRWWKDDILIKLEEKPFAKGAMRECYRMKKLSKFAYQPDWENASNYVAKRYMQEQVKSVYEDDVKLQMDSKLWGEKYSQKNPPKKVDFCQAYLIEMKKNGHDMIFCVEHFIDGEYIKYNSNSGFVTDLNRLTPQAFSHFTFEESGHQSIVVDIQGVGDLYTDPQMHTVDMSEYGEANLGTKGMALFFSSHLCSPLCSFLGLTQFDLNSKETERLKSQKWRVASAATLVSSSKETCLLNGNEESVSEAFQRIELTLDLSLKDETCALVESPLITSNEMPLSMLGDACKNIEENIIEEEENEAVSPKYSFKQGRRSSSVMKEAGILNDIGLIKQKLCNLGQVHYELCIYHLIGRFTNMTPDLDSAMFHLKKAGDCGLPKALYLLGCIHQQLPHQELSELTVEGTSDNKFIGFTYFLKAAECGLRVAMVIVAQSFESDSNLNPSSAESHPGHMARSKDWCAAVKWYLEAFNTSQPEQGVDDFAPEHPNYSLLSKAASLYEAGGFGLDADCQTAGDYYQQAGDLATEAMKGKLASKYYMMAEECWSRVE